MNQQLIPLRCQKHRRLVRYAVTLRELGQNGHSEPATAYLCPQCRDELLPVLDVEFERAKRAKQTETECWQGKRGVPITKTQSIARAQLVYDTLKDIEPAWPSVIAGQCNLTTTIVANTLTWRPKLFTRTPAGWVTIPQ